MCDECKEVNRKLDEVLALLRGRLLDREGLARHLARTPRAIDHMLQRPRWSWLRAIGQRHSGGGPMRWPMREVDAGLAAQPPRARGGKRP